MQKELLLFLLIFLLLFLSSLYFLGSIGAPFATINRTIQMSARSLTTSISDYYHEHLDQAQTIKAQREKIVALEKNHLLTHQFASTLFNLLQEQNSTFSVNPQLALIRTISYAKFSDMNRLWIEFNDFNRSKLYGVIYHEESAGIIINKNGEPLLLLNSDPQCTYAVYVGNNRAPGIVHGNGKNLMIVEYIPTFIPIAVGDDVITSGLDHLFFEGINVGKVIKIDMAQGFQRAIIKPYNATINPTFFHVITKVW